MRRSAATLLFLTTIATPVWAQLPLQSGPSQGRLLWLRADRGLETGVSDLVSSWSDRSGNGVTVTQANGAQMPRLDAIGPGGRAALHFDGNDFLARSSGMPTGSYTKVAVVALDDTASNNNVLSGASEHAIFFGFTDRAMIFHSGTFVTSSVSTPLDAWTVLVASYDAQTGLGTLHQDGVLVGTGTAAAHGDPTLQIGAYGYGNFLRGHIAELMVYDRLLTAQQHTSLNAYLQGRYRAISFPEVAFAALPRSGQVLARDLTTNQAAVSVSGVVLSPGYDSLEIRLLRNGQPFAFASQPLSYTLGLAPFSLEREIDAELANYELRVFLVQGPRRIPIAKRTSVVAGDLLLVNGQSNAVAADYWAEGLANQSQSPWIRSFGNATLGTDVSQDLHWDLAEALATNQHASVGAWALRLAELLVVDQGIPIGLINGAVGGTAIAQHQRNDVSPTDSSTIYGRFLYRARQGGLAMRARALLWHQGESDGENAAHWQSQFQLLHTDWQQDFPALEKLYVFQVRKGCGVGDVGVREVQRTLPATFPDVQVVSTTAAPAHDGCHFLYVGYRELGDRVARLVLRDLYAGSDTQNIDPPSIQRVEWIDANHDTVRLVFEDPDDTLVWQAGAEAHVLLDDGTPVVSGLVSGKTILLQLAATSTAATIRYDGHAFDGPWIQNSRGVGALTFFNLPIQ